MAAYRGFMALVTCGLTAEDRDQLRISAATTTTTTITITFGFCLTGLFQKLLRVTPGTRKGKPLQINGAGILPF